MLMLDVKVDLKNRFLLIVATCDSEAALKLELPVNLLLRQSDTEFTLDNTQVPIEAMTSRIIGAMAFSEAGQAALQTMVEGWCDKTGAQPPELIDLSTVSAPQERLCLALHNVAQLYRFKVDKFVAHNSSLLRQMAILRISQEETLSELEATQQFLLKSIETRRWQVQSHGPIPEDKTSRFKLSSNTELRQLLSASSMGVSDVSFMLANQDIPTQGSLTATLHLVETNKMVGQWVLPAADLTAGWQRLSLICALDQDEQSIYLSLKWYGEAPLWVAGGIHHPDTNYCAKTGKETYDRVLAHQVWKYLPGSSAPVPEDSHWIGGPIPERFYIEPVRLANAVSADPNIDCLQYFKSLGALQVHPVKGSVTAARIARGVPPSTNQIIATIGGRSEHGPKIEYALATAPLHPVREVGDLVMDCERHGRISDWFPLSRDAQEQLTLNLRTPSEQVSDLYLLTRLAPGERLDRGWATFRNIWLST